jgi:demethylmenaquinone methyltransferase/2-methoxy-6-polyprenyl-1,4-benzoquinol methylase
MTTLPGPSRTHVGAMFDRIAPRYDLLNRVLSFGLDESWRRAVVGALPDGDGLSVLDVATGTGDLARALLRAPHVKRVVGVDISAEMLACAHDKLADAVRVGKLVLMQADARELSPVQQHAPFDAATIAFGIRNVADPVAGLRAMRGALKPGGRILVLEFAEPTLPLFAPLYRIYRRFILPGIGGLFSGDREAYQYLDRTIATFPSGERFADLLREAGFVDVQHHTLTLGTVALYQGSREAAP